MKKNSHRGAEALSRSQNPYIYFIDKYIRVESVLKLFVIDSKQEFITEFWNRFSQ